MESLSPTDNAEVTGSHDAGEQQENTDLMIQEKIVHEQSLLQQQMHHELHDMLADIEQADKSFDDKEGRYGFLALEVTPVRFS